MFLVGRPQLLLPFSNRDFNWSTLKPCFLLGRSKDHPATLTFHITKHMRCRGHDVGPVIQFNQEPGTGSTISGEFDCRRNGIHKRIRF